MTMQTPVLISGAGPVGLITAILFARQGIKSALVEKRSRIGTLPRARGITIRSVEILTMLGLGEEVDAISLTDTWTKAFVYTEHVAGEIVGIMPTYSMTRGANAKYSPCDFKVAAQDRLDPLLYEAACKYPEIEIRFDTELLDYAEEKEGVVARVKGKDGSPDTIAARYLIGADGGRSTLRRIAGIGEFGRANLRSFINVQIRADLSRFTKGREAPLIWTLAPGVEGVLQMLDGDSKWSVQVQFDPEKEPFEDWTRERIIRRVRAMIGGPEQDSFEFEILSVYPFTLNSLISQTFRKGRMILVGDAAHQIPPYGGFGLNTGIQTAHNLAWKLGAALRGEASDRILDSYDRERREVAMRVCEFGRVNAGYVEQLMSALRAAASVAEKTRIIESSKQYGNWLGLDLGVHYEGDGAFIHDDVPAPAVTNPVVEFVPHAKPGYRAPHLWVQRGGKKVSTIMLSDGKFVLLAGPRGQGWVDAAAKLSAPAIDAYRVASDGDLVPDDDNYDFLSLFGIGESGAVLIRPDGHVACREQNGVADPLSALRTAMDRVLYRGEFAASTRISENAA